MTRPHHERELRFELFGTQVQLLIGAHAAAPLEAGLAGVRVQRRLQELHRALTRFDRTSELSRLNLRTGDTVRVSPTLFRAIEAAIEAARLSDGLVDPTLLGALERAGYAESRSGRAPADLVAAVAAAPPRRPATAGAPPAWQAIELGKDGRTVRLPAGGRLDLGGSAKGMAVDIAARMLAYQPSFAIDAGGDIRLGGTNPPARSVRIAHPLGGIACELSVDAGAVATSGLRTRIWRNGDGFAHHLIDPGTGTPAWTGVIQATALAPSALEAEALAKTALLRGPDAGLDVLARHGGALTLDDGETVLAGTLATGGSSDRMAA
jgi:thiamine biosynthesis lipoprotein